MVLVLVREPLALVAVRLMVYEPSVAKGNEGEASVEVYSSAPVTVQ